MENGAAPRVSPTAQPFSKLVDQIDVKNAAVCCALQRSGVLPTLRMNSNRGYPSQEPRRARRAVEGPIPEPDALALFSFDLLVLCVIARRPKAG